MPPLNAYLAAAEMIEERREVYSCSAVDRAVGGRVWRDKPTTYEARRYAAMFSPYEGASGFWLHRGELTDRERREWRLTALCFAAAMHDASDL